MRQWNAARDNYGQKDNWSALHMTASNVALQPPLGRGPEHPRKRRVRAVGCKRLLGGTSRAGFSVNDNGIERRKSERPNGGKAKRKISPLRQSCVGINRGAQYGK